MSENLKIKSQILSDSLIFFYRRQQFLTLIKDRCIVKGVEYTCCLEVLMDQQNKLFIIHLIPVFDNYDSMYFYSNNFVETFTDFNLIVNNEFIKGGLYE